MLQFFRDHLLYPLARFLFEFIGDRPWLVAVLLILAAILVWRFLMPWVRGFHALFGWYGWATLVGAVVTLGVFGAGWRAHRDSVLDPRSPEYHGDTLSKPLKPRRVRTHAPPTPSEEDSTWYKLTHGIPLN